MRTFEVGIIGAGIHGASVAFHLAQRGVSTVVFERTVPAGGPTGRSSAVCRAYYTNTFLAEVARDSLAMLRDFESVTNGRHSGFEESGLLFLHPESDRETLSANAEVLNRSGIAVDLLDCSTLAAEFPHLDLDGIGVAAFERRAGFADPAGTTMGLFERAVELGIETRLGTDVRRIEPMPGGGAVVESADGERTACRRLLIAAGPWTAPLARMCGVDLPLVAERHVVATFGWSGPGAPPIGHADVVTGHYYRPDGDGLLCVGLLESTPMVDPDDYAEEIDDAESLGHAELLVHRVPSCADAVARGGWASLYDVSPDWQPVIGAIGDGIFVDAGTSGHGFKLAPALGRYIAAMVVDDGPDPRLQQFSPDRFERGALLAGGYGEIRILG